MNHNEAKELAVIIIKVTLRRASPGEREMLFTWLDEREENRYLYKRIIRGEGLAGHFKLEDAFLQSLDFNRVTESIVRKLIKRQRANAFKRVRKVVAAACLVGALVASYFLVAHLFPDSPLVAIETPREESSKVRLILPSGDQVNLEKEYPRELTVATTLFSNGIDGLSLDEEGFVADDTTGEVPAAESMWCRVVTSTGGQYHVRLQDGTEVWINAASELEFPVTFAADQRVVRLKGEGFFKVSPSDRPFIVETREVATRVLGTSFNVHAYEEDEQVAVTLLEGKVEVNVGSMERSLQLLPGMEAIWTRATGALTGRTVHAENAISWRNGLFIFTGEELGHVMQTLSRWHGVRFLYADPDVKRHLFTGRISMEETVDNVLESITIAGGPEFRVAGDVIYVLK
jgi:ferric-dicitrate binding protein FerR (iron transport regulator)